MEVFVGMGAHQAASQLSTSFEMSKSRIRPQRLAERMFAQEHGECRSQSPRGEFCHVLCHDLSSQQQGTAVLEGHLNAISGQLSCLTVMAPLDVRDQHWPYNSAHLGLYQTLEV